MSFTRGWFLTGFGSLNPVADCASPPLPGLVYEGRYSFAKSRVSLVGSLFADRVIRSCRFWSYSHGVNSAVGELQMVSVVLFGDLLCCRWFG